MCELSGIPVARSYNDARRLYQAESNKPLNRYRSLRVTAGSCSEDEADPQRSSTRKHRSRTVKEMGRSEKDREEGGVSIRARGNLCPL